MKMAFIKYQVHKALFSIPDYIVLSKSYLKFSNELWKRMGQPKRLDFFYEEVSNKFAFQPTPVGGLAITTRSLKGEVKEVYLGGVMKAFNIYIEKPLHLKCIEDEKMWTVELGGRKGGE